MVCTRLNICVNYRVAHTLCSSKREWFGRLWFPIKEEEEHGIEVLKSSRSRRRARPNRNVGEVSKTIILFIYVINKSHMKILN